MPYPLNNVTTQATYAEATTLRLSPPRKNMSLVVTGAAVFYAKLEANALVNTNAEQQGPDTFVPPGRYYFDESDLTPGAVGFVGILVKDGASGVHAQISAT